MSEQSLIPSERIEQVILEIRGQRVIIDADLALLYGTATKRLNEQVKRNLGRFPSDFMFQLTPAEKEEVVANCDHLCNLKFSPTLPYVFTEHGAIMAANVLNSERAVRASVAVVRSFVKLRLLLATHQDLARKLSELESKYDSHFKVVFAAIKKMMTPPRQSKRRIGFRVDEVKS